MGVTQQERVIDGRTFVVSQLPAGAGWKLLRRIAHGVGPAFGKLMGAGSLAEADMSSMGEALATLFDRLTEAEMKVIIDTLFTSATVDGVPVLQAFDKVFQGEMPLLFKALKFAIEVNYGNFPSALAEFLPRPVKVRPSEG
jgi:hypothetical protein